MTPAEITVVTLERAERFYRHGAASVWFFVADYAQYVAFASRSGEASTMVDVGEAIDRVAVAIRDDVIELDQHIATGCHSLSWVASDFAERNPLSSDLFLNLCRAVALVEAARAGGSHLVVVDEDDFGRALIQVCRSNGLAARWVGSGRAVKRFVTALRAHVGFMRDWWKQRRAVSAAAGGVELRGRDVLLMTWLGSGDRPFNATDRYLGKLPSWLRAGGEKFGWLGNPTAWVNAIEDIVRDVRKENAREPIEFVGALQGVRALVKSYACLLMFPFALRGKLSVANIDVSAVVRLFVRREMMSPRLAFAAQYFFVSDALRRLCVQPKVLIYPYENQPWEKTLLMGFRKTSPQTKLVGVQHAPFSSKYLSAFPSKAQWRDGTAPDLLITIGDDFRDQLIAQGAPPDRVVVGGALRFPEIVSGARADRASGPSSTRCVFASCGMSLSESFELAYRAALGTRDIGNVKLMINFHPMIGEGARSLLQRRLGEVAECAHVEFVDGNASKWLKHVDVLLYSSSGVVFEAMSLGIPAIYVKPALTLNLDKVPRRGRQPARDDTLRAAIRAMIEDDTARMQAVDAGYSILKRVFSMPERNVWMQLLSQRRDLAI